MAPGQLVTEASSGIARWLPCVRTLRRYRRSWLAHDAVAGIVLTAVLVPAGMGYAEAAGLPAIYGLYATIVPLDFIRRAWHPYDAVLGRVDEMKGYHDVTRHPDAKRIPGLVLFRWDAPLFFANAEVFADRLRLAVASSPTRGRMGRLGGPGRTATAGAGAMAPTACEARDRIWVIDQPAVRRRFPTPMP